MSLNIALKTFDGNYYVCAEGGGDRELVANRQQLGPWETFRVSFVDPWQSLVTLKTWDDRCYLSARPDGGLSAVQLATHGPWEIFKLEHHGGRQVSLQAHTGMFVCAENGGGFILVANRWGFGPWETFLIEIV